MKIDISYPAFVTDRDEEVVVIEQLLSAFHKTVDTNANLSNYLSPMFEDFGVSDGQVVLEYNSKTKTLNSIITYNIDEPLPKEYLDRLIEETTGQLTDGYGETPWEIKIDGDSYFVSLIDLFSGRKYPVSVSIRKNVSITKKIRRSPIFSALENGNIDKAKKYLDKDNLFTTDKWGSTPLMKAISYGHSDIAVEMIKLGANVNHLAEKSGLTPLTIAAMNGDVIAGKALIEYGADVNVALNEPDGLLPEMTPLMWASNRNYKSFVKLLLENGVDVNIINSQGQTALMFAAEGTPEQLEIFELLIKKNPILTVKDWRGRTIIDEARARANNSGMPEMRDMIAKYYPEIIFD